MVKKRVMGYLLQDVGLILLLVCIFTGALTLGNVSKDLFLESVIMMMGICFAILFAGFKLTSFAIVTAGFEVLVYTVYRLYLAYTYFYNIPVVCYIWIALPIAAVGAMNLFISGNRKTELENEVLKEQVEELVMVNPLTGLYNLRSLYYDLKKQISYVDRNGMKLSFMIIELRYEPELRSILTRLQYETLLQKLALYVADAIRTEDRVYSIDNKGTVGVLLTCDKSGSEFVAKRIKQKISDKNAFAGIKNISIKVEVRLACLQYIKEEFGDDMIKFKQKVESELQYDV